MKKLTAEIVKDEDGTGLYMRIEAREIEWAIQEDEVSAIMEACKRFLEDKYPIHSSPDDLDGLLDILGRQK